jgi:hypothetical protein
MSTPSEELATILRYERSGAETETQTFWRIVYWAGGGAVTDEDVRSLPDHWKRRLLEALIERPATRQAHPNYLRHASPGEWTEARMEEVRVRRDRAFARIERVLLVEPASGPGEGF